MSSLRAPGVGPIVGHTTDTSCRIWIRAGDPEDKGAELGANRRTIGVLAVVKEGKEDIDKDNAAVYYFRLHREFDRTGTFNLGTGKGIKDAGDSKKLKPATKYWVRVGTLTIDDPYANDESITDETLAERLPDPGVWFEELKGLSDKESEAIFRTFSGKKAEDSGELSFIVGSCRYPGLLWKAKHADAIFGPLLKEARGKSGDGKKRRPAEFVMMVGDQIYADMLNRHVPIGLADTFEEFQERYLSAFRSKNMRALLRQKPTYMILDDHEIEDNWHQDRVRKVESRRVFNIAIGAYMSYQWSHGPREYGRRLFYNFESGGYPFFVLDTRTQRFMDDVAGELSDNHMLGRPALEDEEPSQLDYLLNWLDESQDNAGNVPKFIVTSSVFVPNPMRAREGRKGDLEKQVKWKEGSDSWPAFPATKKAILDCIVRNYVQFVVFLSGDIHCSNVAELEFSGSP